SLNQVIDSRNRHCLNQRVRAPAEDLAIAGAAAQAEFDRRRWKKIREHWRVCAKLLGLGAAAGEQQTAAVLGRLGAGWHSIHDVPQSRGNWDHICVGPAGVFLLETKDVSRPAF